MTQIAAAPPRHIVETQPSGHEGVKYSLAQVARMVVEGGKHPRVIAFARKCLKDAGNPQDDAGKARAIFDGWRASGQRWCSDPKNTEFIAAAQYLVPDVDTGEEAMFVLCDCDEQTIGIGACMLAINVSETAIVGHSYDRQTRSIGHVLNAFHDGKIWVGVDGSYEDGPFGTTMAPEWEIVIAVPSMEVLCNGTSCTGTKGTRRKGDPAKVGASAHVRLEGLPHRQMKAHAPVFMLGDPSTDPGLKEALSANLYAMHLGLKAKIEESQAEHAGTQRDLAALGISLADNQYWSPADEAQYQQIIQAADYFDTILWQASEGTRAIAPKDGDPSDFVIQLLPTDTAKFLPDSLTLVPVVPPVDGATLGEPITAATVAVVIAISAASVIATIGLVYVITRALDALNTAGKQATDRARNEQFNICRQGGGSPAECQKLQDSLNAAAASEAAAAKAKADAEAAAANAGATAAEIVGGLAVAGGAVALGFYTGILPAMAAAIRNALEKRK